MPAGPSAEPAVVTGPFVRLWVAHFLQALGYSSMLLLPLYLDHLGASRAEIGAVMASAAVGGLLGRPLVGWALDSVGRKPVLLVGTLVLVAGMALVAAIETLGPLVYVMRILVGLGTGSLFTGYFTLAADIVPESRRAEGIALFGISGLTPLLVNPLTDVLGIDAPSLRWFLPAVGLGILASLVFLPGVPERPRDADQPRVDLRRSVAALRHRSLWPAWTATAVFAGLVAIFMSFVTVTAEDRGIAAPASVWATYAGGAILVRLLGARLPERLGLFRVGAASLLLYAGGVAVAAGAHTTGAFAIAGLLAGVGHGYCFPVLTAQVVTRSPIALRGVAMAAFTGLWELARLVVAPSFGAIADAQGDQTMLRVAAVAGVVGLAVWWALERGVAEPPAPA